MQTAEFGAFVISVDAILRKALLLHRWHGLGEAAFEPHEIAPCYGLLFTRKSVPFQAAGMVDRFDCADQYLFRVAATQRAGATKRLMVDDCDTPSGPAGSGKLSPWRRFRCR
jgi:hypothetical protein